MMMLLLILTTIQRVVVQYAGARRFRYKANVSRKRYMRNLHSKSVASHIVSNTLGQLVHKTMT